MNLGPISVGSSTIECDIKFLKTGKFSKARAGNHVH